MVYSPYEAAAWAVLSARRPPISELKLTRLNGVATAALDGQLDADTLRAMPPEQAGDQLRRRDGIGPTYSALVTIRATGHADVLPTEEPLFLSLVADLYGLSGPPDAAALTALTALSEPWRPFRTWVAVLIRAAASRL